MKRFRIFALLLLGLMSSPFAQAGRDCSIFRDALQRSACEKENTERYMREQQSIRDQHQSYYQRGQSGDAGTQSGSGSRNQGGRFSWESDSQYRDRLRKEAEESAASNATLDKTWREAETQRANAASWIAQAKHAETTGNYAECLRLAEAASRIQATKDQSKLTAHETAGRCADKLGTSDSAFVQFFEARMYKYPGVAKLENENDVLARLYQLYMRDKDRKPAKITNANTSGPPRWIGWENYPELWWAMSRTGSPADCLHYTEIEIASGTQLNLQHIYTAAGECAIDLGRRDVARSYFEKALATSGNDVASGLKFNLIEFYLEDGDDGGIKKLLPIGRLFTELSGPDSKYQLMDITALWMRAGAKKPARAIRVYESLIAKVESDPGTKFNVSDTRNSLLALYKSTGQQKQAKALSDKIQSIAQGQTNAVAAVPAKPVALTTAALPTSMQDNHSPPQKSKLTAPTEVRTSNTNWMAKQEESTRLLDAMFKLRKTGPAWELETASKAALAYRDTGGNNNIKAIALMHLGMALKGLHSPDEAKARYEESLACTEQEGNDLYQRSQTGFQLGQLLRSQQKYPEAEAALKQALQDSDAKFKSQTSVPSAEIADELGGLYKDQKRYDEAEPLFKRAVAASEKSSDLFKQSSALDRLADLYLAQDRYAERAPLLERQVAILEKQQPLRMGDLFYKLTQLQSNYESQSKFVERGAVLERLVALHEKRQPLDEDNLAEAQRDLADNHVRLKRYADAEPLYLHTLAIYEKDAKSNQSFIRSTLGRLVKLYDGWKKPEERARYMSRYQAMN